MYLALDSATDPATLQVWINVLIGVVVALLGGGGVGAVIKARADKAAGVSQTETAEDDAVVARWQKLIETQTLILLDPLQKKVSGLETEVSTLKTELTATHQKYWSAIGYIRQLLLWFNRNMPENMEDTQIPQAPARLTEDL